jgi:SAM-dependent methyltransferase
MPRKEIIRAVVAKVSACCRPGDRILDLSCGEGEILSELLARGFKAEGTHYGDEDYILRNPHPVLKSAVIHTNVDLGRPLPFPDNSFQAVLATEVFEHLPEHPALLREIGRILAPGGFFLFTTPNMHSLGARLTFFFTGMPALQGGRLGWNVPPEDLYSTHHHPVDLAIFHSQLQHAELIGLRLYVTKTDILSVLLGVLTPVILPGAWLGTRRHRREHQQGGRELLKLLCSPALLFSTQLFGVAGKMDTSESDRIA